MKKIFTTWAIAFCTIAAFTQQSSLWIQKANYPTVNQSSVSFSIGALGYLYTGAAGNNFYVYNPAANTWAAMASFPGVSRTGAAGFATDSFGYVGSGKNPDSVCHDFYRYDPVSNTWAAMASYPDSVKAAFSFCINNTGYFAGGINSLSASNKCYAYNAGSNLWIQKANLPMAMGKGFSAVVDSIGYCGLGAPTGSGANTDTVFAYNAFTDSWATESSFPISNPYLLYLYSFVVNGKIFMMNPDALDSTNRGVAVFNPLLNSWSTTNLFPAASIFNCGNHPTPFVALGIGNTGYFGNKNCTGINFWQYDPADSFVVNSFTPDTLCERGYISVTISTNIAFNGTNFFKLNSVDASGNQTVLDSVAANQSGTYNFKVTYNANWPDPGAAADLAVVSSDPDYVTQFTGTVFIKQGPAETVFTANSFYCSGGSAVVLYADASFGTTDLWTSKPTGIEDSTDQISFTPNQDTYIYLYALDTLSGCGVTDTFHVSFAGLPVLNISDSVFQVCPGTNVTLGGTATADCAYQWTGSGLNNITANPVVAPVTSSAYHVQLTDTVSGCIGAGNTQVNVSIAPAQTICLVTVDSATSRNLVVWEKLDKGATDSFHIYREISTNNYAVIASIPRDSLSEYEDGVANPAVTGYRYKITVLDTCGNESVLSPYHNTIHLEYIGNGQLLWNDYAIEDTITPVSTYDVLIDTSGTGTWQLMATVPGTEDAVTDTNYNLNPNARYLLQANWAYTCTPTRSGISAVFSNIVNKQASGIAGLTSNMITLYPNPVNEQLTVESPLFANHIIPLIYDVTGQQLAVEYDLQADKAVLNTSSLAAGLYWIKLTYNGHALVEKFVKVK